jgi:hypothetical protein
MSPAQRRKRLAQYRQEKHRVKKPLTFLKFVIPVAIALFLFFFLFLNTKLYSRNRKLTLVSQKKNGDIVISVFSPKEKEITAYSLPGTTQLTVSRQLGTWKAKSIIQLGINENVGGKLLAETIIRNFYFPIIAWQEGGGEGFVSGKFGQIVRDIFFGGKTNLSLSDRINLGLMSLGVPDQGRTEVDFTDTGILRKTRLVDGEDGYILTGEPSTQISSAFAENENNTNVIKVAIEDATGIRNIAEKIGKTIENLGTKVVSIRDEEVGDFDCTVSGKNKEMVERIALIFSCQKDKADQGETFDIILRLGDKFAKRF